MAYEEAMKKVVQDDIDEARVIFETLLKDPLIEAVESSQLQPCGSMATGSQAGAQTTTGPGSTFIQLRFLLLKNLAYLAGDNHEEVRQCVSQTRGGTHAVLCIKHSRSTESFICCTCLCKQAMSLYMRAAQMGCQDPVFLHRLADAAFRSGQHGLARQALERALLLSPGHPQMTTKLMRVSVNEGICHIRSGTKAQAGC